MASIGAVNQGRPTLGRAVFIDQADIVTSKGDDAARQGHRHSAVLGIDPTHLAEQFHLVARLGARLGRDGVGKGIAGDAHARPAADQPDDGRRDSDCVPNSQFPRHANDSGAELATVKPSAHMGAMAKRYPFVIDTLGKMLEAQAGLSVHCGTCHRNQVLDIAALAGRLGADFGCMHWDLIRVLYCAECRAAGREDRKLDFIHLAETPQQRNQKRET